MDFPNEKLTGNLWGEKTPSPSVVAKYQTGAFGEWGKGWTKYLVRELSKVPGGMDGLTMTDRGYTNQPDAVPEGQP
jgi:hypothetical protein